MRLAFNLIQLKKEALAHSMLSTLASIRVTIVLLVLSTTVLPAVAHATSVHVTSWVPCLDFPQLECRNITVPRFYDDDQKVVQGCSNGTLRNLERRLARGEPTKYIWLIDGGPSANSDYLAAIAMPQIAEALEDNFIVQISYQRGSQQTESIENYAGYPENFDAHLQNQSIPIQAYTSDNIVKDVISSVKLEKAQHPKAKFYGFGISYGTYLLGRLLQLEPDLFSMNIFDGVINQNGPSRGTERAISLGLLNLPIEISRNCRSSPECRSWGLDSLITFVEGLTLNQTTPCFDAFISALKLDGSASQIYDTLAFTLINSVPSPGVLPQRVLQNQSVGIQEGIETSLQYWQGIRNSISKEIVLDYRVLLWVLTNDFAQCNAQSRPAFEKLLSAVFGPVVSISNEIFKALSETIIKVNQIPKDHIIFSEFDHPVWTKGVQKVMQTNSLIRQTDDSLEINDKARIAHAPYFSKFLPPLIRTPVIRGDVIVLGGILDANTPYFMAEGFFEEVRVSKGRTKKMFTFRNAGHQVSIGGYSACMPHFWRAYVGDHLDERKLFRKCMNEENAVPLDWGYASVKRVTGEDIWEGLEKS